MSPKKEAVERLLKGAADAVSDWGWKGGKPGEVTGGEFWRMYHDNSVSSGDWDKLRDELEERLSKSFPLPYHDRTVAVNRIMENFRELELADVPREWTGKIMKAFNGYFPTDKLDKQLLARTISDLMRDMPDDMRGLFLKQIKADNTGRSLQEIAALVRRAGRRR